MKLFMFPLIQKMTTIVIVPLIRVDGFKKDLDERNCFV